MKDEFDDLDNDKKKKGGDQGDGDGGGLGAPVFLTLDRIAVFFKIHVVETMIQRLGRIGPAFHRMLKKGGDHEAARTVNELMTNGLSSGLPPEALADYIKVVALYAGEHGAVPEVPVRAGSAEQRFEYLVQDHAINPEIIANLIPAPENERMFQSFLFELSTVISATQTPQPGEEGHDAEVLIKLNQTRRIASERILYAQPGTDTTELSAIAEQAETMLREAHTYLTQDPQAYEIVMAYMQKRKTEQQKTLQGISPNVTPGGSPRTA